MHYLADTILSLQGHRFSCRCLRCQVAVSKVELKYPENSVKVTQSSHSMFHPGRREFLWCFQAKVTSGIRCTHAAVKKVRCHFFILSLSHLWVEIDSISFLADGVNLTIESHSMSVSISIIWDGSSSYCLCVLGWEAPEHLHKNVSLIDVGWYIVSGKILQ